MSADGDVDRKRRHPAVRRYLPLHRGITLAVLLGGISRKIERREASDDEAFADAARAIAMGGDR